MKSTSVKKGPKAPKAAKAPKPKKCAQRGCKQPSQNESEGYCRLHYIANWKHIKFNDKVKAERRLNAYVDRIAKKFPKDYLEKIKETLENEGKFKEMVSELDIDLEAGPKESDDEFLEKFLRAVKPGSGTP